MTSPERGDWLPSPFGDRRQHLLQPCSYGLPPLLLAYCGAVLVNYPTDDRRVPWTIWPRCPDCAQSARQ